MAQRLGPLLLWASLSAAIGCGLDTEGAYDPSSEIGGFGGGAGVASGGASASGGAAGQGASGGDGASGAVGGSGGLAGGGGSSGAGGVAGAGGSGGSGGSAGSGDPCAVKCTDPQATCTSGACLCGSGFVNSDQDGDPATATCIDGKISGGSVEVGIDHDWVGHVTIKLQSPKGTVLTLMSRPGHDESSDNGGDELGLGDEANLRPDAPVTFSDTASTSAEDMGSDVGILGTVCSDGSNICEYHPEPDKASGAKSFASAFGGEDATGAWQLCVGDSVLTWGGSLQHWTLTLDVAGGSVSHQSVNPLSAGISDNGYNGQLSSMTCRTLTF